MKHVISIQSQVVHGHVGNSAAMFPMQSKGVEVAAIPTVLLSNHPRYPTHHGQILNADLVAALLQGVEDRGLIENTDALLTGYLGSIENADIIAGFVERALQKRPDLIYVCDPVIGDDDSGVFVAPGLVETFRDRLLPMASVITPNHFELELLADSRLTDEASLRQAADSIIVRGTRAIVVTGCVLADSAAGTVETILCSREIIDRIAIERLPIRPCGTGDLLAGLITAELVLGTALPSACRQASSAIFDVLKRTQAAGTKEMQLIASFASQDTRGDGFSSV